MAAPAGLDNANHIVGFGQPGCQRHGFFRERQRIILPAVFGQMEGEIASCLHCGRIDPDCLLPSLLRLAGKSGPAHQIADIGMEARIARRAVDGVGQNVGRFDQTVLCFQQAGKFERAVAKAGFELQRADQMGFRFPVVAL